MAKGVFYGNNSKDIFWPADGDGRNKEVIIDKEVIKAIKEGFQEMYLDLVYAGEKEFADETLETLPLENKK